MNKFTKKVYLDDKYHIGDERWKFFAYTKIGQWFCEFTYKLSNKFPKIKILNKIHMLCLPF